MRDRETYSFLSLHSADVYCPRPEETGKKISAVIRGSRRQCWSTIGRQGWILEKVAGDMPKARKPERVGKSHEWPRNVNEAPLTQFCLAPLHPPVSPLLALSRGERKREIEREGGGRRGVEKREHPSPIAWVLRQGQVIDCSSGRTENINSRHRLEIRAITRQSPRRM